MDTTSDWIVVAGFLLALFGLSLRIFMMMRSSDTHPVNTLPKDSRIDARLPRIISEEQTSAGDANLTLPRHRPFNRWSIAGISLMRSQRIAGEPLDFVTRHGFGFGNPGGIACPTTLRSAASFAG